MRSILRLLWCISLCLALFQVPFAQAQVTYIYKIYKWATAGAVAGGVAGASVLVFSTKNKAEADEYMRNNLGTFAKSQEEIEIMKKDPRIYLDQANPMLQGVPHKYY